MRIVPRIAMTRHPEGVTALDRGTPVASKTADDGLSGGVADVETPEADVPPADPEATLRPVPEPGGGSGGSSGGRRGSARPGRLGRWFSAVGGLWIPVVVVAAVVGLGAYFVPAILEARPTFQQVGQDSVPAQADGAVPTGSGDRSFLPVPPGQGVDPGQTRAYSPTPTALNSQPVGSRPVDALGNWVASLSDLGIPPVALQAYGYAHSVLAQTQPSCKLSWTLLAGIGSTESNHGAHAGAQLQPDGSTIPKIIGIPLDGTQSEKITDTDGGKLDGDTVWDRAMGPMQFIPTTWTKWGVDADGDGVADPYNINDAALAAGYYLCAGGRDLSTAQDWWAAVWSYNPSTPYGQKVFTAADGYGRASIN